MLIFKRIVLVINALFFSLGGLSLTFLALNSGMWKLYALGAAALITGIIAHYALRWLFKVCTEEKRIE